MQTFRLIWNYKGHNSGLFDRGLNWWQVTIPPSRNARRVAMICWWPI
jgi:hypothetical protein